MDIEWNLVFLLALGYNLSLLIFNKFFTSNRIAEIYPEVFSNFGQVIVIMFGFIYYFAFISCRTKELFLIFAIEKFIYFGTGVYWMIYKSHSLKFGKNPLEWVFMRIYWIGDAIFGALFLIYFSI